MTSPSPGSSSAEPRSQEVLRRERPTNTGTVLSGLGLVKKYASAAALAGVDVEVGERESLAIMGPSGSGKSTLLHTLAGIIRPDDGQVLLRGERIDRWGENRLSALRRKHFGFVFQFGQLMPEPPAEENIALTLMPEGVPRKAAVARARRWFAPLGLDGLEGRRPGQLSGGQAQRVASRQPSLRREGACRGVRAARQDAFT